VRADGTEWRGGTARTAWRRRPGRVAEGEEVHRPAVRRRRGSRVGRRNRRQSWARGRVGRADEEGGGGGGVESVLQTIESVKDGKKSPS